MPVFTGDGGANVLDGSGAADTIDGAGGGDRLFGGLGADAIFGGAGDDAIWGFGVSTPAPDEVGITASRILTGLNRPVFATFAPSSQTSNYGAPALDTNRLFIVEAHTGQIRILDLTTNALRATPFLDIADSEIGQGSEEGLLGLAFHPQFASNGKFYVHMVNAAGNIEIRQYSVSSDPNVAVATGDVILTVAHPSFANHNGGWIGFGPDGYLYIALGDGGSSNDPSNNAQNTNVLLGKMLRIDVDGDAFPSDAARDYSIPASNPFAASAGADEIWAYGLRNPWRNAFDVATGDLYIADVGQGAREEINFQAANQPGGLNYGWDVMEGDLGADSPSFTDPVRVYGHDNTTGGFSITGGYVYRGPATAFDGAYFYADYVSDNLWTLVMSGGVAGPSIERDDDIATTAGILDQISSFALDGAQRLYAVGLDGELYRFDLPADRADSGNFLFGGDGNDRIYGGSGADLINGGSGADLMDGGAGDDIYEVTDLFDTLIELPGGGIDGVRAVTPHFMLPSNIENLINFAAGAFTGFGNDLANFLRGNAGADSFFGGAGNDRIEGFDGADALHGEAGDDYIWGGAGNDLIAGGAGVNVLEGDVGDDVYDIASSDTFVIEQANGGIDSVRVVNALPAMALGANIENLFNFGVHDFIGYGNDLANFLRGADGGDTMYGYGGADRLEGWGGDDRLVSGAGDDFLWGGLGHDVLVGEDGADIIEGFDGSDAIVGGAGADLLSGGRGIDGYYGQGGDDVFVFAVADLEPGVRDYLWDYSNVAGDNDQIRFEGIAQNSVSYEQQGGDVIISIQLAGGGIATILAANTTVAVVQADVHFP